MYGIEEPETSQHPDSQEQIIRAFMDLTAAGDQVLITTHVPGLAGLVPLDSLQHVDRDSATKEVRIRKGTPAVYNEIAAALGVLPDPVQKTGLRVAVLVEGKNDIDALRSMAMVLAAAGEIPALDESKIFWTIGGGTALKDWIERRYLEKLGVPQVVIRDSDRSAAAIPLDTSKAQWLQSMATQRIVTAFITEKRNMDNYLHPDVLGRMTNGALALPAGIDLDFVRIADELHVCLTAAKAAGLVFAPEDHAGAPIAGSSKGCCKQIISAYFMRQMTADEFCQRCTYTTSAGQQAHETRQWFDAITAHLT